MEIKVSARVASIGAYAFAAVDEKVAELKAKGITPIDFGVGDYQDPTPPLIRKACKKAVDVHAADGYPSYVGSQPFREAVAAWLKRRFDVSLDPKTQITSTIGSKEGIFNFAEGFVNPGDYVICPSPGYPPYKRGTLFAEGKAHFVAVTHKNKCKYDFKKIPAEVASNTRIMWVTTPSSPLGYVAELDFLKAAYDFCQKHGIILASDEAYSELYFKDAPHSALELGKSNNFDGIVQFHSLSKRSIMTGWRVGWAAGDKRIIDVFKKVKTNIDSGTPNFVQDAAIAALSDEKHVEKLRRTVKRKRNLICTALRKAGLKNCKNPAGLYLWQKAPDGMTGEAFAKLLIDKCHVVTTPGEWLSDAVDGENPGAGHVRFAFVPPLDEVKEAASRIEKLKL
ncbi:MAG: aminotransferase class I/II-fold pyridoxal phosphate-dependent enzyme [Planctomycetes bacterium]|nr:aminotransferase class I/II-fold pyridoxal phosphate-dependent enzyme [Planctomycetota bacterium]MCW8137035.1 aminotransferase class I/II-fold pyridoxal phosphate-dependent enzyme [Planctomycetota bacterium]